MKLESFTLFCQSCSSQQLAAAQQQQSSRQQQQSSSNSNGYQLHLIKQTYLTK